MSVSLEADPRVVRFLRRQEETRAVIDDVRGAALALNEAIKQAVEIGLEAEVKVITRRSTEAGARYSEVIPSIFLGREVA